MSEIKSNKISPRKGTTTTIGDSGDSVTISSGTTTTNAGTISTAGISGGTINNTTGSITGLQQQISWQTGDIKTASFTASANEGYFLNTTSGQITVTLPASPSAGDVVAVKDYADTFDTNKAILNANGNKIQGSTTNFDITVEGTAAILLYVDSTKGWLLVDQSKAADITEDIKFVTASGGTETTSGNFKIHTFTGPGTFTVTCAGNAAGSNTVSYLVLAGGGSGGYNIGGGGGAGGFRESKASTDCYSASPLNATSGPTYNLSVPAQAYPITVGGGASGSGTSPGPGNKGSNSVFSTITSTGGGGGGSRYVCGGATINNGGSGGGGGVNDGDTPSIIGSLPGSGNTPPVSPPQGQNGGGSPNANPASGGGGAGAAGATGGGSTSGPGGNGVTTSINASPVTRAGGGGGGAHTGIGQSVGTGGSGGGTDGIGPGTSSSSPANSGGGSGGGGNGGGQSGNGGSGVVIIRYKSQ